MTQDIRIVISILNKLFVIIQNMFQIFYFFLLSSPINFFNRQSISTIDSFLELVNFILHIDLAMNLKHPLFQLLLQLDMFLFDLAFHVVRLSLENYHLLSIG